MIVPRRRITDILRLARLSSCSIDSIALSISSDPAMTALFLPGVAHLLLCLEEAAMCIRFSNF